MILLLRKNIGMTEEDISLTKLLFNQSGVINIRAPGPIWPSI